jgi:hypothetical protein
MFLPLDHAKASPRIHAAGIWWHLDSRKVPRTFFYPFFLERTDSGSLAWQSMARALGQITRKRYKEPSAGKARITLLRREQILKRLNSRSGPSEASLLMIGAGRRLGSEMGWLPLPGHQRRQQGAAIFAPRR